MIKRKHARKTYNEEDNRFFEDGIKNLVARTLFVAISDAKQIGNGKLPPDCKPDRLLEWASSDRCDDWTSFVGVQIYGFRERLSALMSGRKQ